MKGAKKWHDAQRHTDWKYITKIAMAEMTWVMQKFYVRHVMKQRERMEHRVFHPLLSQKKQKEKLKVRQKIDVNAYGQVVVTNFLILLNMIRLG